MLKIKINISFFCFISLLFCLNTPLYAQTQNSFSTPGGKEIFSKMTPLRGYFDYEKINFEIVPTSSVMGKNWLAKVIVCGAFTFFSQGIENVSMNTSPTMSVDIPMGVNTKGLLVCSVWILDDQGRDVYHMDTNQASYEPISIDDARAECECNAGLSPYSLIHRYKVTVDQYGAHLDKLKCQFKGSRCY